MKNTILVFCLCWILGLPGIALARHPSDFSKATSIITFGSGNKHNRPQPHWEAILATQTDLWIWLGDNIYADTIDMSVMKSKYHAQFARPDYSNFRKNVDIIGIWDDHDFGASNSGKWYPRKRESQVLMLDFLEEPTGSDRRRQEGVYCSYVFGPLGKRVKIILLDNRYHADRPGPDADLLGENQWAFLKRQLKSSDAQLLIIGSGIQILPTDHAYEKWENFPRERKRLLDLIRMTRATGVVLISGDRHIHEISLLNDETVRYPLVELTSSGMTHSYKGLKAERNRYRVGDIFKEHGFGLIQIKWEGNPPGVSFQVRDINNRIVNRLDLPLSILQPNKDLDHEK